MEHEFTNEFKVPLIEDLKGRVDALEKQFKTITVDDTNKDLNDLRQKLINEMYEKSLYEQTDVEILKLLLENDKKTADECNLDAEKIIEEINRLNSKEKDLRVIL